MDNQNRPSDPAGDEIFEEFFKAPQPEVLLDPDISMTQELDLENIIAQTKAMDEQQSLFPQEPNVPSPAETVPQAAAPAAVPEPVNAEVPPSLFPETPMEQTTTLPSLEETTNIPIIEEKKESAKPKRKVRPKRKKGPGLFGLPHLAASIIWMALLVFIGAALGRTVWLYAADLLAFGKPDHQCTITITVSDLKNEDAIDIVAGKLKDAGLIRYPELFKLYAKITDAQEDLITGTFTLRANNDYHAIVAAMSPQGVTRETVTIMIPEGYTCAQIFRLLDDNNVCSVEELELYCATGKLEDYWFLEGVQQGDRYCLEGYLFPDTYEFYVHDEAENVISKFLNNFDYRFTDIMEERLTEINEAFAQTLRNRGYGEAYIQEHQITIREVVIIASMIEKETANDSDSYNISSVIYNRLGNPGSFPFLNIDATIVYAMGGTTQGIDTSFESPYNTYLYKGLPPGPISNPGRNSLNAALSPNSTDYYYYVYDEDNGQHIYARTQKEHENNVNRVNGR